LHENPHRDDPGVPLRVFDFNSAIVRKPARSVINGLRANAGPGPTFEGVAAEHRAYVEALKSAGMRVTTLEALEDFPDSIFVEDPALVFTRAAILLRPGAPSRQGEVQELSATLSAQFESVLRMPEGYADGGDVLVTPNRVLIGLSSRTDVAGATALQKLLGSIGLDSEVVRVPAGTLHLKTDCSLLDAETILATAELATSGLLDDYRLLVPPDDERHACNAIRVNEVVLMRAGCPRTQEMLAKHGLNVVVLPTDEIAKIDAGLSCMSLRWLA
jgi:dimethylargininase